jgi:hypothetical protein
VGHETLKIRITGYPDENVFDRGGGMMGVGSGFPGCLSFSAQIGKQHPMFISRSAPSTLRQS